MNKLIYIMLCVSFFGCRNDLSFDTSQLPPEVIPAVERGLSYWPSSGITLNGGNDTIITVPSDEIAPYRGYTNWECTPLNGCIYLIRLIEALDWNSCVTDSIIAHEFSHVLDMSHTDPTNSTINAGKLVLVMCE